MNPARGFWPSSDTSVSIENFIDVFKVLGYVVCNNAEFEDGYLKVALYTKRGVPSHMARQKCDGSWTSKLGESNDIVHHFVHGLEGDVYGVATVFMKKKYRCLD